MPSYTTASPRNGLLEVGISMVLRDNFSKPAYAMTNEIRRLNQQAKMANTANLEAAYSIGDSLAAGAGNFLKDIWGTVKRGAEYIDTMTTVGAISQATAGDLEMLSDRAQSLGLDTMFSSMDIASGMKYLAMAGNGVREINDMIEGATYVAGATGMALGGKGGAADMITNVAKAFRKSGKEAINIIGDQLTMATLSSNISMQDLAESIKYASADLVSLKRELPEVAAMIGTLGNAGIQGSMAGVALSNMARYLNKALSNVNSSQYKALQELGISISDVTDSRGDLISFAHVLELIKNATADMTSMEVNDVLNRIFGVRGFRAANALMHDLEGLRSLETKIATESQGYAKSITEKRMATLAGSIEIMEGAWENVRTSFTEALQPLAPVVQFLGKILDTIRKILDIPVVGNIIAITTVLSPLILLITGKLMKGIAKIRLLQNDAMISGRNMLHVLLGGWKGVRMDAEAYAATLARINLLQAMGNKTMMNRMGLGQGWSNLFMGGVAAGMGKGGKKGPAYLNGINPGLAEMVMTAGLMGAKSNRGYIRANRGTSGITSFSFVERDSKGKFRKSTKILTPTGFVADEATMKRMQQMMFEGQHGPGGMFGVFGMGNEKWRPFGKSHSAAVWKRYMAMNGGIAKNLGKATLGMGRSMLGGIGKLLGGAMGLMGGPLGVAIMGLTLLPGIMNSIGENIRENKKLKAEIEKNTYAANTLAGQYAKEAERRAANKNLNLEQELMLLRNSIIYWSNVLDQKEFKAELYMDGKFITQSIDRVQSKNRQTTGTK